MCRDEIISNWCEELMHVRIIIEDYLEIGSKFLFSGLFCC